MDSAEFYSVPDFSRSIFIKLSYIVGTFSLALAFAGNDLVNFIGVPMAGWNPFDLAEGIR